MTNRQYKRTLAERFQRFVAAPNEKGCMLWLGSRNQNGYGTIHSKGMPKLAHRVAWELVHSPIPDGMYVCHHCDVRACVNIEHLFLGTRLMNMQDAVQKGRIRGEYRYHKVTEDDVHVIRLKYNTGLFLQQQLANDYGVSRATISAIVRRENWKHI